MTNLPTTTAEWKEVQQRLKDLKFYFGKIDGSVGPLTDNAIIEFKKSIGFKATPYYGPLTHDRLMGSKSPEPKPSLYPWYDEAKLVLGTHERYNTSKLKSWFHKSVAWIDPREISWCGAFMATCILKWDPNQKVPANTLGARQWGAYGERCSPQRGAVLTFWRGSKSGWQGHVGFYAAEDASAYHVLGGNQSDSVTITRIAKDRLLESRWPTGMIQPNERVYGSSKAPLSVNEA